MVKFLNAQTGQIICPLPETTSTLAAVAWEDAVGVNNIAITKAVTNVSLIPCKTTSLFTLEHGLTWMDAGESQFSTFRENATKKGGDEAPP
jgi:hypothetical protein